MPARFDHHPSTPNGRPRPDQDDRRPPPYREYAPAPHLAGVVACYWTYGGGADVVPSEGVGPDFVVPDGCMDLLFDLSEGTGHIVGAMTEPLVVERSPSDKLLGVRFRPGAAGALVGEPAHRFTDRVVPVRDADTPLPRTVTERLCEAAETGHEMDELDALVGRAWLDARPRHDPRALTAASLVADRRGRLSVTELATAVGLGRRQLERRFLATVGVPPRTALRVARFQAALIGLQRDRDKPLSWIALDAGYHDQAHFTREFRRLAGETPGAYRARRRHSG